MKIGFIGTGNMGGALAKAASRAAAEIYLYDKCMEKAQALAEELSCHAVSLQEVASCHYIFLGVKPQMMESLFLELSPLLKMRKDPFVLVSMAAGVPMARICQLSDGEYPVIRIMPNMPVSVGAGMILYDITENVTTQQLNEFLSCMEYAGVLDRLPETLIDAGTSVSSCGPAFAFLFMEELAKGGVACGLSEDKAMLYAKQMLLGSAKLALESTMHPSQLRQAVCSPGGSTIEGIHALQNGGFSDTVMQAVAASYKRNQELGK